MVTANWLRSLSQRVAIQVSTSLLSRAIDFCMKNSFIRKEVAMFAYALLLIVVLPVAFLSSTIESLFSPDELTEMGIHIRNSQPEEG
jgi:hypothetical protein